MTTPRLICKWVSLTCFADRVRIGSHMDGNTFFLGFAAEAERFAVCDSMFAVDLPLKDRAAYKRASAAFNKVMDEHQAKEDAKNVRRRARKSSRVNGRICEAIEA